MIIIFLFSFCSKQKFDTIIQNVNIINVENGDILFQKDVAIHNQYIKKIANGKSLPQSDSTIIIDGTNKYLIPGLWDMHVHLAISYEEYLQLYLANGVTGVREMNGFYRSWKTKKEGSWLAPRFIIGSRIIDGPKPFFNWTVSVKNEEDARKAVREMKDKGYDFIKVLSLLPANIYYAIVDECKKNDIPFAGHLPFSIHPIDAAKAGQQSNEHLEHILLACSSKEDSLRLQMETLIKGDAPLKSVINEYHRQKQVYVKTFSQQKADTLFAQLGELNLWQCPTLIVFHDRVYYDDTKFKNDPRLKYFPDYEPEFDDDEARERGRIYLQKKMDIIPQMYSAGIQFLAGTDNKFLGFSIHDELGLLVEAGLSPLASLQAATINPAKFLARNDSMGTIAENKIADLVLLEKNPLENINNTRSINTVIYNGHIYDNNKMLNDVELFAKRESFVDTLLHVAIKKDVSTAIKVYYELKEKYPDRYIFKQDELTTLAFKLTQKDMLKEAIEILKLGVKIYPESAIAYVSLGTGYMMDGQKGLAIENYNKSLELEPSNNYAKEMIILNWNHQTIMQRK